MVDPSEIAGEIIDAVFSFLLILWFTTGLGLSLLVFFVWAMRYAWIHAG